MPAIFKRETMAISIREQLLAFVELQKIDHELYKLRKELSEFPALQKKAEEEFSRKKAAVKVAEDEQKAAQLKQKEKEMDLGSKEEKIKKLQSQLYSLKTNKEYQAMEMEIKGLKADDSLLEEDILRLFDAVEIAKTKVAAERAKVAEEEKKLKAGLEVLAKKQADIQARISALESRRKEQIPHADPKLLPQYERILQKREGLALVPVKNNSCGGCHMEFPAQMVHEIQMQDKIIICESCARIIYWP